MGIDAVVRSPTPLAIHSWVGGSGWNSELMGRLTAAESRLDGGTLTARQIGQATWRLLRDAEIKTPTLITYKG